MLAKINDKQQDNIDYPHYFTPFNKGKIHEYHANATAI